MKRFVISITLACVFAGSALAGDMPTGGIAPPPPSTVSEATPPSASEDMPTVDSAEEISDAALSALLTAIGFLAM